jgi:hypothetical protein
MTMSVFGAAPRKEKATGPISQTSFCPGAFPVLPSTNFESEAQ